MSNQPDNTLEVVEIEAQTLLTTEQTADYIGLTARTLETWRTKLHHKGPAFIRLGSRVRYRLCDVDQWLEAQRVDPAASN